MPDTTADASPTCNCKLGRVAAAHGLEGIHTELETRWGATSDDSLRDLAKEFNQRVLRAGVERSGRTPLDGEISNLYRVLTDDDVDAGSRTQARERLRRDGVPIDDIEDGFVSHQTVYRHLVECLDVTREPAHKDPESRVTAWHDRVRSLQARLVRVAERGMKQLRETGSVEIGSFEVYVDVNIFCNDCGRLYTAEEFLDSRACECGADDTPAE